LRRFSSAKKLPDFIDLVLCHSVSERARDCRHQVGF